MTDVLVNFDEKGNIIRPKSTSKEKLFKEITENIAESDDGKYIISKDEAKDILEQKGWHGESVRHSEAVKKGKAIKFGKGLTAQDKMLVHSLESRKERVFKKLK